jgi:F0F1-type ATP synthase membrane subunit b/b'
MNFTILFTVIICVVIFIYICITLHIIKRQSGKLVDYEMQIKELSNECDTLSAELKNLHNALSKKQEVENETKQNLANIASGTTDDSVDRLQHPEKRRKTKSSSKSKDNSSGV